MSTYKVEHLVRFELTTYGFEDRRSIQLSYRCSQNKREETDSPPFSVLASCFNVHVVKVSSNFPKDCITCCSSTSSNTVEPMPCSWV